VGEVRVASGAVVAALLVLVEVGAAPAAQLPQGTIVYASSRTGNFELYSVRADGTRRGQLTRTTADETNPTFSPDGRWILFMATPRSG
jgi:WD40-like Beta Propeller Repeat